jgi:hypothetical protein
MAAGQGFKTFATGDVLSAADVNGYLMQGVLVFADSAERDAEITSPEEGQFAYLKDTNVTTYYTGSVWANLDTTGMTNPMTTTGDVIYSSSGSTPARLGIGTAGQVLQVNSGATAPEWATPASGGSLTLLSTTTLSGTTTTISGISGSYQDLLILVYGKTNSGSTGSFYIAPNGSTSNTTQFQINTNTTVISYTADPLYLRNDTYGYDVSSANNSLQLLIRNYANTVAWKPFSGSGGYTSDRPGTDPWMTQGAIKTTSAITSLNFTQTGGGSFTAGTVKIYGVN